MQKRKEEELQIKLDELSDQEEALKKSQDEARKQSKIQEITDNIINGDARDLLTQAPDGFNLLLIDPPYGRNLAAAWRKATPKKKIANDESLEVAIPLLTDVLTAAYAKMADNSSIFVRCDWKCEAAFMEVVREVGFVIKNRLIRKKINHGSGDTETTFAPQHESIIYATKGRVPLSRRLPDVLEGAHLLSTDHPTPKPIDLMEKLIEVTTYENDIVVDCFMGC